MTDTIPERVARGAEWLDKVRPEWWREIDLGRLRLMNGCDCILAQIVGYFIDVAVPMRRAVGFEVADDWIEAHGFSRAFGTGKWADLDAAWIAAIKWRWESA